MGLLGGGGTSTSSQNYIVTDFITSRQAVEELQRRIHVVNLYSMPSIDWWSRFPKKEPIEEFVNYWQSMVTARYDMITGIADAQIRAFSPADAQLVASTLVTLAEELINNIDKRSQEDAVRFAEKEVEKQKARLQQARDKLTAYRNKFGIIDPTTSVAASNSALIQGLRANLAQLETQLATFQTQNLAPNAPAIVVLKSQIKSVREQLARTEADVGTRSDNGLPLSTVVGDYEELNLEVQFAQNMLTGAMQALTQARVNALTQHLYITPYVRPHLPESSIYPRRFLSVLMVGLMAFSFWVAGLMIVRSIRERFS
jgi:capsular polysaccharide transport system permease protein